MKVEEIESLKAELSSIESERADLERRQDVLHERWLATSRRIWELEGFTRKSFSDVWKIRQDARARLVDIIEDRIY